MSLQVMSTLPIEQHLKPIQAALVDNNRLILVAQPGAGKTTRVPLALLNSQWAKGQRLLLLEPRRVAARLAASFMAAQLGEPVGKTVGYRIRGDSKVGPHTRLEVVTQGVLTRMLQDDPLLEGVAGIIFDEFHERSIEADLGLALSLDIQQSIRDDLRLMVMSATLDVAALIIVLGTETPVIESTGREFPIETHYRPIGSDESLDVAAYQVVAEALANDSSLDVLVILPGVAEITRLVQMLENSHPDIEVRALHGSMPIEAQQAALKPHETRQRVIVSTAIAESSVTVDGVNVVIDAGLERVPLFQPRTGLTRLTTRRVNRASADQRRGRAGRQQAGICYRLWSKEQPLVAYGEPEIAQADLSRLALEIAMWGARSPNELAWMTPPPNGAWQSSQALLRQLGILDATGLLTPLGKQSARWPLEPRLAVMLSKAASLDAAPLACALAALLDGRERVVGSLRDALAERFSQPSRFPQWQRETKRLMGMAGLQVTRKISLDPLSCLLAMAYPDRIGQFISSGRFKLANGKTATLSSSHPLANTSYLVAVSVESATSEATIYQAEPISLTALINLYPATQQWEERITWSDTQGKLLGEVVQRHGELVLARRPLAELTEEAIQQALLTALKQRPSILFDEKVKQLQGRMALLASVHPEVWPDWSERALLENSDIWLAPYMAGMTRFSQLEKMPFHDYLIATLDWNEKTRFERLAPTTITVPSGNQASIDYAPCLTERPPVLALKLQEAFGWQDTPVVADGHMPVVIHLLSPAKRPLQVTQDLRSFWLNGYPEVRKEMRGRYPKHPWPENPLTAQATAFTKRR
ncbi:ATP-dependent helicase HrpB [Vreelandella andesensis]|uniref:ATP-dependent helicase HrpB n=1 Tax=Vreelandella andesensis TaxID=447567 RepID=A0A3S0Y800_9GAMM|nr:ATP-dependent helicase HrpB [Halomonas andesensis]RUR34725.1 ATP-dependent helicase HrpB [Halomonas andesensis]